MRTERGLRRDSTFPNGVAVDSADNVYVADLRNHAIRKDGPLESQTNSPPTGGVEASLIFAGLRLVGATLSASVSGLSAGATGVVQSSLNLRDWTPVQTNTIINGSITISRSVNPASGVEFLRVLVR